MTSIALSGRQRPVMYRPDSSTAGGRASSVICHAVVLFVPLAESLEDLDRLIVARSGRPGSPGNAAPARCPSRCTCGTRRRWWRRCTESRRARAGLSTLEASIAPSAPPAPTSVCSSSMNRMDVLGAADLVHDRLDALLELTAVLGAGDHHGQVEHDDPPVVPAARARSRSTISLGEALDDGRLADARPRRAARGCSWCGGRAPE